MAAPDPRAPAVLRIYPDGRMLLEIEAHDGRVIDYLPALPARGESGLLLTRVDQLDGPYRVYKPPGRMWACTCKDTAFGRAARECRSCKHRYVARNLLRLKPFIDNLARDCEEAMPAKRKPDEAPPHREGAADAPAPAPAAAPQALTPRDLRRRLADPFPAAAVGWKPTNVSGNRCLALAYIDARDVMDRLDDVVGVDGWSAKFTEAPDGTVACDLRLRMPDGTWLVKGDVGGESEQKDAGDRKKAAYSDALKRAAVHWNVGRYLYSLPTVWADYDATKKQITRPPSLPAWALPGGSGRPPGVAPPAEPEPQPAQDPPPPAEKPAAAKAPAKPWHARLAEKDVKLAAEGLCEPGELVKDVAEAGVRRGHSKDFTHWIVEQIEWASERVKLFEAQKRQALAPAKAS